MKETPDSRRSTPKGTALAVICTAQFVLQLDFSIVNVALATIQRDLHFAASELQWVVTGYALTFGSLLLFGGRASDLTGRRRMLIVGLAVFATSSLACGLAQSPVMLVVSRMIQGAGAALVSPSALALLTNIYEEGPDRVRALGIFQATTAGGATAGIVAGGVLTQYFGWRAVFLVNLPIVAVLIPLALRKLPAMSSTSAQRPDLPGALLITTSLAAFIYGLSNSELHGLSNPLTMAALAGSVALAGAFVWVENVVKEPMIPFSILRSRTRGSALASMVIIGAVLAAYVYFMALFLQRTLGYSVVLTGVSLLPATLTVVLTAGFVARRVMARVGTKYSLLLGLTSMMFGQFWLSHISASSSYLNNVVGGLMLTTFGVGMTFPTISVAVTNGVVRKDQGLAGGLLVTSQQIGGAIGLALLATVAAARTRDQRGSLVAGYRLSYLIATGLIVLIGVIVVFVMPSQRGLRRDPIKEVIAPPNRSQDIGQTSNPKPSHS